jgi:FHA domain
MKKLRQYIFIIGFVVVGIGAFGLLTTSPWPNQVNSFFTVFGFMMSFAQVFVGFPLFDHSKKPTIEQHPDSQAPDLPSDPMPVTQDRGVYITSSISLILGSIFLLISSILGFAIINDRRSLPLTLLLFLTYLIAGIFIPLGLPYMHRMQAARAGILGLVGITIVIIGWIAYDLIYVLFIAALLFRLVSAQILQIVLFLNIPLTLIVLLGGNILFGIAIIRAGIFPRWMGIASIVVGIVSLLGLYQNSSLLFSDISLAISSLCGMFIAAFYVRGGWILFFHAKNSKPASAPAPQLSSTSNNQPSVVVPPPSIDHAIWGYLSFTTGRQIQLSGPRVFVGRSAYDKASANPEIDLTSFPEGNTVSHFHAAIQHSGSTCIITDLNSMNSTYVNGKRIDPNRPSIINDRDMLYFGRVNCTFRKA